MPRPNPHQDVDSSGNLVPWSPSAPVTSSGFALPGGGGSTTGQSIGPAGMGGGSFTPNDDPVVWGTNTNQAGGDSGGGDSGGGDSGPSLDELVVADEPDIPSSYWNLDAWNKLYGKNPYEILLETGLDPSDLLEQEGAATEDYSEILDDSGAYLNLLKGEAGYNDMFGIDDLDFGVNLNPFGTSTATVSKAFQEGGLASLANPHKDRREDVIPPMMSEGEFLGLIGRGGLRGLGRMGQAQMRKPPPPFGATRENELDQLMAWKNAPHHVDPPNIGFKGEKIPAPLYNRIMKYLEGVSPAERTLLDELINREGLKKFKDKFNDKYGLQGTKRIQEPIEV